MKNITATAFLWLSLFCSTALMAQAPSYQGIIYVTPTGAGTHSGDSWANATSSIDTAQTLAQEQNSVVWVAAGIYYGNTTSTSSPAFTMKNGVNVYGGFAGNEPENYDLMLRDIEVNATILDGQNKRTVLYQPSSFTIRTRWDGFFIQNGYGVYLDKKSILNKCIIQNNSWQGIRVGSASYITLGEVIVSNCKILNNIGSGIDAQSGKTLIANCLIANNTSCGVSGSPYIVNTSILNNTGLGVTSGSYSSYTITVINSIVWGNGTSGNVGNISGNVTCSYSAIEGGYEGDNNVILSPENPPLFVNPSLSTGAFDSTANVDWHLQQGSPCINRGNNSAVSDSLDLDGTARIKRDTVDLGCYESDYYSVPVDDTIAVDYGGIIYVTQTGAGTHSGDSWANAISSIDTAQTLAEEHNAVVWVAAGTYYGDTLSENAFVMKEGVSVYGGFAGNEPADYDLSLRNFEANTTVLDGDSSRRVLCQPFDFNTTTIWDGFTICNGQTNEQTWGSGGAGVHLKGGGQLSHCRVQNNKSLSIGGGIYCSNSIVDNCTIANNSSVYIGGGAYATSSVLSHCIIEENVTTDGGGWQLYLDDSNDPCVCGGGGVGTFFSEVTDCQFISNISDGCGGGIIASASTIYGCSFIDNISNYSGGGVFAYNHSTIDSCVINNNLYNNEHEESPLSCGGGGVFVRGFSTVINCHVSNNISNSNGGGVYTTDHAAIINCQVVNNNTGVCGGGIFADDHAIVSNCQISNNKAEQSDGGVVYVTRGGGIYAEGVTVSDCQISNNMSCWGAGIYTQNATITHCQIFNNTAEATGGGIHVEHGTIKRCTILHNTSNDGGGIFATNATVSNCQISNNIAEYEGGGARLRNTKMTNCLVSNNTAGHGLGHGGGIAFYQDYEDERSSIFNSTIVRNKSSYGAGMYSYGSSENYMINCVVWGNENNDTGYGFYYLNGYDNMPKSYFSAMDNDCTGETNIPLININPYQPLFVNPSLTAGASDSTENVDWHLQPGSILINKGCSTAINDLGSIIYDTNIIVAFFNSVVDSFDLDGTLRIKRDTLDIGCYESDFYGVTLPDISYADVIYVTPSGAGSLSGENWDNAISSIESANILARKNNISQIWVAAGTYYGDTTAHNAFTMHEGVNVFGGFAGNEPANYDLSQRNLEENATILDGQHARMVLTQPYGFIDTTVWDGFSIRNGYSASCGGGALLSRNGSLNHCQIFCNTASYGGGIWAVYAIINNCLIFNNISSGDEQYGGDGGGVYSYYSTVSNCLIANNTAASGNESIGGGFSGTGTIVNSTIVNNCSEDGAGVYGGASTTLTNSIVWGNEYDGNPHNLNGNISCSFSAIEGGYDGDSIITLSAENPPLFVNPSLTAGASDSTANVDWHLQQGSPCINRGNNEAVTDSLDLGGTPRIKRDTVDLGCYESDYYSISIDDDTIPVQYSGIVYVTPSGAGTHSGDSWANAISSIDSAQTLAEEHNAVVWVAAGTYYGDTTPTSENAFTMRDGVSVYGGFEGNEPEDYNLSLRDFELNTSILDGQNERRVLYRPANCNKKTIWDGFTIQNGQASQGGGAIINSKGVLNYCIVKNNNAHTYGGGVYAYGSEITNCHIFNNSLTGVVSGYGGYGGGLYANYSTISNCQIYNNIVLGDCGFGGGLQTNNTTISNSRIYNNTVTGDGDSYSFLGGGIHSYSSIISNCIVSNNTSKNAGGGIGCGLGGSNTLINSIVVRNLAQGNQAGGGIYTGNVGFTLINSIIWGNKRNDSPNNLQGDNFSCSYSAIEDGYEGENVIVLNDLNPPLFVNPSLTAGASDSTANVDWHLQQGSPCINRGNNSAVSDSLDLDGTARIKRDTVDLGCYESDYYSVPVLLCNTVYHEFSDTACDTYSWNDQIYTQSGSFIQSFELPNGCDSIVTLHLTVNHSVTTHEYLTTCASEVTYAYKDTMLDVSTPQLLTINSHLLTQNGCDSTVVLYLTVLPSTVGEFTAMTPTDNYPLTNYPIHFTWDAVENASGYELYVWPIGEPQPQQPTAANIYGTSYVLHSLPNRANYQWMMKAYNACDTSVSSIRQFSLNVTPSLTVNANNPIDFGEVQLNSARSVFFQVNGVALDSAITYQLTGADTAAFSLVPTNTWNSMSGGRMQLTFHPQTLQNEFTAQMTIQSNDLVRTFTVKGYLADFLTFTTYVDSNIYAMDSDIPVHGQVINAFNEPVSGLDVEVYVKVMDYVRTYPATSDANGQFTIMFTPQHSEAGYYTVGSRRTGSNGSVVHDEFNIPGMMLVSSDWILWEPTVYQPDSGAIAVRNRSQIPLTNIQVTPVSLPNGCTVQFAPLNLAGMATGEMYYTVSGSQVSTGVNYEEVRLNAVSNEGAGMSFTAWYYCLPQRADLDVTPTSLVTTMTRGQSKIVDSKIYNNGTSPTGNIYVSLPNVPWMSLVGSDTLPSLAVHDSAYVSIRLSADSTTALVRYTGNIAVNCERGEGVSIPYDITAISDSTGTLVVDVTDEYTWNTNNGHGPHLAGANVIVKDYYSLETVATGVTDANGLFVVNDLPEGYYKLIVRADRHAEYQNNLYIMAGDTNRQNVFIEFQAITYSWEVVPTEIEDEYTYDLNVEFETHVPKPVVVIELSQQVPELAAGESMIFDMIVTNYGLITANDVEFFFPSIPNHTLTPLISIMDSIPALSTFVVPVEVRHNETVNESASKYYYDGMEFDDGSGDPCWKRIGMKFSYICGPDKKWQFAGSSRLLEINSCVAVAISNLLPYGSFSPPHKHEDGEGHEHSNNEEIIPSATHADISCEQCDELMIGLVQECCPIIGNIVGAAEDPKWSVDKMVSDYSKSKINDHFAALLISDPKLLFVASNIKCFEEGAKYLACKAGDAYGSSKTNTIQKSLTYIPGNNEVENMVLIGDLLNTQASILQHVVSDELLELYEDATQLLECGREIIDSLQYFRTEDVDSLVQCMTNYTVPENQIRNFAHRWNVYMNNIDINSSIVSTDTSIFYFTDTSFVTLSPIDIMYIDSLSLRLYNLLLLVDSIGYNNISYMFYESKSSLDSIVAGMNSSSVCASVTVQFSQKMTMTREAFEGTLTINNGHESEPMQDIDVDFVIKDENGVDCTNLFQINFLSYNNMTGTNGNASLDAQNTGSIVVQFIPTKQAAPEIAKRYAFGGSFSFIDPFTGESMTYNLYPVDIIVNPSPDLYVNYFMQRDILGDDPLTEDRVEPIIPAELGVIIHNRGAGIAKNVLLETAEPRIIDNDKGLAVDFAMYGAAFNGQERQLGLMEIPFGNIEPNHTGVGEWWFTSTLLGHFVSYEAHVIHNNSFGNPDLSLVSSLAIHPLIHTVYAYGNLDDGINDFLVDDNEDIRNYPDSLYFSNGSRTGVATADSIGFDHYVTPMDTIVILTLDPSRIGWNYEQTWDPGRGQYKLISCTRNSDQQVIPLSNVWQTHVTLPVGADPIYENKLHIVDTLSNDLPITYTLVFSLSGIVLEVDTILNIPDTIAREPLASVTVQFNKPIVDSTFDYQDITLKCNNGENLLDANMVVERIDSMTYNLHLNDYTQQSGLFVLNIQTLDITDAEGYNGYYAEQAQWVQALTRYEDLHDTVCDSTDYAFHGDYLTASGLYLDTVRNITDTYDSVVYRLHLTVNYTTTSDTTAVACDSFTWHGVTYSESGDYPFILTNTNGCDSVVTLHLTVNYSNTGDTSAVACDSYDWYEHTGITTSGNYTHTFTNAAGCDSVVTLHLTVNYSNTGDTTAVACDSYNWYEHLGISTSGDYTHTFTNASGCDSVVTLHLTVNFAQSVQFADTACDSFTWYDTSYTESGDYSLTLTNVAGCDSVITLHLTINHPQHQSVAVDANGFYTWNDSTYTSSGTYTYTHTDANGCTQVDTLYLTIHTSSSYDFYATACDNYIWNDSVYTSSGDYVQHFINVFGGDSIVTLHLTILELPALQAISGETEVCINQFTSYYYDISDPSYQYRWFKNNDLWAENIPEITLHEWDEGSVLLTMQVTDEQNNCVADTSLYVQVMNRIAPDTTEIRRMGNTNMLVCRPVSSEYGEVHYRWGYTDLNSSNEVTMPGDHNYCLYDFGIDTLNFRYWVETYLNNSMGEGCDNRSYYGYSYITSLSEYDANTVTAYISNGRIVLYVNALSPDLISATVYDVNGKMLLTRDYGVSDEVSDIIPAAFSPGVYFLKVNVGNLLYSFKLLKM